MRLAGERLEHCTGAGGVRGFFENATPENDNRVRAQNDFGIALPGRIGFGARQTADVVPGIFGFAEHFFDGTRAHDKIEAGGAE